MAQHLFAGLQYLHSMGVIHTDIKPDNILLDTCLGDFDVDNFTIKIADLGSSAIGSDALPKYVGTFPYCAPEVLLNMDYNSSIDIWAACVTVYGLVTGDHLFDINDELNLNYGTRSTIVVQNGDSTPAAIVSEAQFSTGESSSTGDKLDERAFIYNHLYLIERICGSPPAAIALDNPTYYNVHGRLKNDPSIDNIKLSDLLYLNYQMDKKDCDELEAFLVQGICYQNRETADNILAHSWLNN